MGLLIQKNKEEKKVRSIYIDLLSKKIIKQPEQFCSNFIKTTHYSL